MAGAVTVSSGDAGEPTHWSAMTSEELWQHIAKLDSTVTVGLKEPGKRRGVDKKGRAMVSENRWRQISRRVVAQGAELLSVDDLHPLVELQLTGPDQIERLRRSPFVEYVEPASFDPTGVLMSTCGSSNVREEGQTGPFGDIIPYTLARHSVPDAWQVSTGAGVTVGIIDTGTSVYQPQLQEQFDQGQSSGRTITYDFTDPNGASGPPKWHDTCGHGTKTLGLATAPRDGRNIVGVAYKANAYAVRAIDNVLAGPGQWEEIREGVRRAALNSDIVSMSFGWSWGNSSVANTIRYYYYNTNPRAGRETLFFAAAGSNTQGLGAVSFPADMDEVFAVTGTYDGVTPCDGCNYGDEVEFAAYTAGQTTGSNTSGVGDVDAIGKSSGSSPLVAGVAALVWSKFPDLTRDQVVQRLRANSSHPHFQDAKIGHGVVNALMAVGGLPQPLSMTVGGPSYVAQGEAASWRAIVRGGTPPYTYDWSWRYVCSGGGGGLEPFRASPSGSLGEPTTNAPTEPCNTGTRDGGNGKYLSFSPPDSGTLRLSVFVEDADGGLVEASKTVEVSFTP